MPSFVENGGISFFILGTLNFFDNTNGHFGIKIFFVLSALLWLFFRVFFVLTNIYLPVVHLEKR